MELETERLRLRAVTMDDVDALHALWTDADVRRFLWDGAVIDRETAYEVVQGTLEDWGDHGVGLFSILLQGEEEIIGFCGVRRFPPDEEWELLYGLLPAYWGNGLAVEASAATLRFAFTRLPVDCIAGRTDKPNAASIRVLQKLGMRPVSADGMVCYSIDRARVSSSG
ncbi:MAG: GNAT family N-acetyltransferase [Acidobacteria bacterium]|nr:GNAT family N-acetyltransferase [Acidobacteriota bacterium]